MKCRRLVAFTVVLASFSGRSVAAPADPNRMLAEPTPMFTEWQLRPVSNAWRVGEHRAQVWKRLYRSPLSAMRSNVGMLIGPPKALVAPKPMSSINMITTLGAPAGGR